MRSGRSLLLAAALVFAAATGLAQTHGKKVAPKKSPPAKTPSAQTAARTPSSEAGAPNIEPETTPKVTTSAMTGKGETRAPGGREKEPGDAGVQVLEKGDGGSKQFRFTETDIEGRLNAPELVYFLRRVRAEFAAGDLGHRSFMRELSETKHDPNF